MKEVNGNAWKVGQGNLIGKINQEKYLMYYFGPLQGLETKIIFQDSWMKYIIKNQEIIRGWLEYKMILTVEPIVEIYGDNPLTGNDICIDHLIFLEYVE